MAKFIKENTSNRLLNRSSQRTIDALESISATDMALALPYIKITKIDPGTRNPATDSEPLNVFFQKPPEFGVAMVDRGRFAERPPVSLESFSVTTKQNYGHIIEQHIEMKIIAHRPSAVFGDEDSIWTSIITPGDTHLVEYGWAGSSKNGLVNGEGFDDDDALGGRIFIPSRKSIMFTTYYYTFAIRNTGEIEFTIKGMQNGNTMFRQIQLGDVTLDLEKREGKSPDVRQLERSNNKDVRKKLQSMLSELSGEEKRKSASFSEVLNVLLSDVITNRATQWGYDRIDLIVGKFNPLVAPVVKGKGFEIPNDEIADFIIPLSKVRKIIEQSTRKGTNLTISNFIESLISSTLNASNIWSPGLLSEKSAQSSRLPQIMVKALDESTTTKKVLKITIFDSVRDLIALFPEKTRLYGENTSSRQKIRDTLEKAKVPFVSFGKANSFIVDSNFDVVMDPQIQRAKIDAAAKVLKQRSEVTSKSLSDLMKDSPEEFHKIFSSAIQGTITMIGNFAFDTFSSLWLDFQVRIWDGPFVVRQRTDVLSPAGFETTIEVYSEATDPLNTKRRLTRAQTSAMERLRLANAAVAASRKKSKTVQRKAKEEQSAANENLSIAFNN